MTITYKTNAVLSHMMDETTWMNAKKAVELGFADNLLEDTKKNAADLEAYSFSASTVENAIMNKIAARAKREAKPAAKPEGRSVDSLMDRLNLLKY